MVDIAKGYYAALKEADGAVLTSWLLRGGWCAFAMSTQGGSDLVRDTSRLEAAFVRFACRLC